MKYLLGVALAALTVNAAHAEMFNGGYIGIQAGLEQNKVDSAKLFGDATSNPQIAALGAASVNKKSVSGATIGLNLGFDYKVSPKFVLGGEFAGTLSTSTNKQLVTFANAPGLFEIDYKSRATFEITARAGVLATDKALIYVRGGYANSKLKATFPQATTVDPVKGNNSGFVIGGGVEYALTSKVSAKVEGRFFDFKGPISRTQVVIGLGYHF